MRMHDLDLAVRIVTLNLCAIKHIKLLARRNKGKLQQVHTKGKDWSQPA